jgi:hypothetical protein
MVQQICNRVQVRGPDNKNNGHNSVRTQNPSNNSSLLHVCVRGVDEGESLLLAAVLMLYVVVYSIILYYVLRTRIILYNNSYLLHVCAQKVNDRKSLPQVVALILY